MNGYERRTLEKKKQVVTATYHLINSDKGVAGITMADIATQAGVSKTSLFKYFGSKEDLISQVFMDFLENMGQDAEEIVGANLSFEDTLMAISNNEIKHLKNVNKQFYLDLMDYATQQKDSELSRRMEDYTKQSFNMIMDIFHRGRKEGKVDLKYSDQFLLLFFQAMVEGVSSPHIYEKILPYTSEWMEIIIKGVAPKNI